MSKKIRIVTLLIVASMLILGLAACSNEEIVAKVDDVEISRDEFNERLINISGNEVLETLISEVLVDLEAEKEGIEISQEEIDEELAELQEYYGGEEALNNAIENSDTTMDELEEQVVMNLKIKQLVAPYIEITDEQVETYYESNADSLGTPEQVGARHILVETEEEADEIYAELQDGGDFEELAKEHSTDEGTAESGGELGLFGRGEMAPEFEEAAFSMDVDEISEPVESQFGFHIIRVEEKNEAEEPELEEVEDDIRDTLFEQQVTEAYGVWYQEKSEEYDIVNYLQEHEG